MVFSGIPFLFYYLPVLLLVYYAVPTRFRALRNGVLVFASLLFYAWGEGLMVGLLMVSIVANHMAAHIISIKVDRGHRKITLALGIALNLAVLVWFKYAVFIFQVLGFNQSFAPELPLGISFFTFQAISYLVDVYRKEAEPAKTVLMSALYISSFPQLIAGPIVRYKTVARQIVERKESWAMFTLGIHVFVIGLAQKVLIANVVGITADEAFNNLDQGLSVTTAWLGLIAYGIQIFFDFAGYSNMAIGLGYMLGFTFPANFNTPYTAKSITEFWRRWHMTLSEWFRDYLYISLGGNRHGTARTILNLWIVFLLCGLWHGAAWTFIAWGAWHGFFLSVERLWLSKTLKRVWLPLQHAYLLVTVFLGWVLFRAEDIPHALNYYAALLGMSEVSVVRVSPALSINILLVMLLAFLIATGALRAIGRGAKEFAPLVIRRTSRLIYQNSVHWLLLSAVLLVSVTELVGSNYNPFIYFRF
ncbi:MAG: MBOAT family protein [Arenicella sp.]|nr:MBOAT family protein [Arenicella sp.]